MAATFTNMQTKHFVKVWQRPTRWMELFWRQDFNLFLVKT